MSLRARLTLAFAVVSFVSLTGLAAASLWAVSAPFEDSAKRQLEGATAFVSADVGRAARELDERLQVLAVELERFSVAEDVLAAAADKHTGSVSDLQRWISTEARSTDVDLMKVVRDDGMVVAAHPFSASIFSPSTVDHASVEAAKRGEGPSTRYELIGPEERVPALLAATPMANGRVVLVVGTFLDQAYVDRVAQMAGGAVVLVGTDESLASPAASDRALLDALPKTIEELGRVGYRGNFREGVAYRHHAIQLPTRGEDVIEATTLWMVVGVSDAGLVAARRRITLVFVGLGVVFLLFSFLAGGALSRRFSAPIESLEQGAAAIAAGDLDHRVPPASSAGEIDRLIHAFNQMAEDLKNNREQLARSERVAAWREMARMIAHEIKNPLTPIQLAVQTTQRARAEDRDDFDEIFEESANAILEEVSRLRNLVQEFTEFARMPAPNLEPQELNEVIKSALGLFTGLPDHVKLTTSLARDLPVVDVDRDQISRVVVNLVSNAAEAIEDAESTGNIEVATASESNNGATWVTLRVRDDGPGVDEETREKLFTPYFTTKSNGTGLGLAIVHRIVSDHQGRIEVDSTQGRGTTFTIWLRSGGG